MDIGIAEVGKSEKKHWGGGKSSIEGAELSIGRGGGRGPLQKYTNWHQWVQIFATALLFSADISATHND